MVRTALWTGLLATALLLPSPLLAGGDGSAGGNSGFNPAGGSALTPIGTANFSSTAGSTVEVPVSTFAVPELAQALLNAGLNQASADGVLALLSNQAVNGVSPQQGGAALVAELQAAGAGATQAAALADALGQLGTSPSLQTLASAVAAFNALVATADSASLTSLAAEISPIRGFLISVIENVKVTAG